MSFLAFVVGICVVVHISLNSPNADALELVGCLCTSCKVSRWPGVVCAGYILGDVPLYPQATSWKAVALSLSRSNLFIQQSQSHQ